MIRKSVYLIESILLLIVSGGRFVSIIVYDKNPFLILSSLSGFEKYMALGRGILFIYLMLWFVILLFKAFKETNNDKVLYLYFGPVSLLYLLDLISNFSSMNAFIHFFICISGVLNSVAAIVFLSKRLKQEKPETPEQTEESQHQEEN